MPEGKTCNPGILPVPRSRQQAGRLYDRISRVYGFFAGTFERKYAGRAADRLCVTAGETVLEVGFGPGYSMQRLAGAAGRTGRACGVDISAGMLEVARRRLERARLADRVALCRGDATSLPYRDGSFDAAFMSFTLELFDTPEIPEVLAEVGRVLKPGGRVAMVSMSRENGGSVLLRLYEWAHRKWPEYLDCRPIYLERALRDAGYRIRDKERIKILGLPGEIVLASKRNGRFT